jgi:hypothetical protein
MDRGRDAEAFIAPAETKGRYFYGRDMQGFNFERRMGPFGEILQDIVAIADSPAAPAVYIGSVPTADVLPGFDRDNCMGLLPPELAAPRIWVGNRSEVSAHFDLSAIACVVARPPPPTQLRADYRQPYVGPLDIRWPASPPAWRAKI